MRSDPYVDVKCDDCNEQLKGIVQQRSLDMKSAIEYYGWTTTRNCDFCPKCSKKRARFALETGKRPGE